MAENATGAHINHDEGLAVHLGQGRGRAQRQDAETGGEEEDKGAHTTR